MDGWLDVRGFQTGNVKLDDDDDLCIMKTALLFEAICAHIGCPNLAFRAFDPMKGSGNLSSRESSRSGSKTRQSTSSSQGGSHGPSVDDGDDVSIPTMGTIGFQSKYTQPSHQCTG